MPRAKRADRLLDLTTKLTGEFDLSHPGESLAKLYLPALALKTGISANNVSMEMGRLYREGRLLRVGGRPVAYLALEVLERKLGCTFTVAQYASANEFLAYVDELKGLGRPWPGESTVRNIPRERDNQPGADSRLDNLVGARESLAQQIHQAKAAITYPPFGLHTLCTGPTGTGKSLFANAMFDYAVKSGALPKGASIVTFDCAHYSENPQLLLSQLFGYMKGSFTGADKEHIGLVEHADGGILFLDEIHRLTPEGQEKMFLLMDHGVFRRLGETGPYRHARVLIIGATTEDAPHIMLNTFLRRIPVHIVLPELEKRTIRERLELVLFFIWRESQNIRNHIILDTETLRMLVHYKCPANVGQLSSDIKLTCANAYYDFQTGRGTAVEIQPSHLSARVSEGLFVQGGGGGSLLMQQMLRTPDQKLEINGRLPLHEVVDRYIKPGSGI